MSGHYVSRTAIFNTVPEAANSQWILVKSKEKGRKLFSAVGWERKLVLNIHGFSYF